MNILNNLKSISKGLLAIITLSIVIVACSKDHGEPQQLAGLAVIHAWPDTIKLDFIVDQTRATDRAPLHYNSKLNYLPLFPGTRRLGVTKRDSTKLLIAETFPMAPGKLYSVFIVDTVAKKKFLFVEDDLTAPEAGKAKVRFINLSPGTASYNLGVDGKEDLFTNKLFKEYSTFENVETGEHVTFNIKDNSTKDIAATLPDVKIESGKIYTIYAKGLKDATVDSLKLGAAIYTHE